MDGFEKEYIKNKLGKKKGKTPSKQPEQVFEDFAKKIAEIITNKEPIAAKIIREQSNKTLNKTNYLMGFQGDKKTVSKQNQSTIVKPSFPAFQKGFVSHGAIDYDFAIMESKLEQENVHHENHGHDGHSGDSDIKKRVASGIPTPSNISLTAPTIYVSGLSFQDQDPWTNGSLFSPYNLVTTGYWESINIGYVGYFGGEWQFYATGIINEEITPALVATNTALPTSLPTTGWVNSQSNLIVSGTLVISTTP
jgi:hypothetical protein